ncbi:DEAD/DEAH box helicase [uncultured Mailhella sp.]|uniref:DEAD/DEAH box helicase n=1 Tax=uncultured Mailhella sp. TaxID=1981031 RepID=UPI0025EF903E|nr:DEAD/DEAH box helicase [uncultured Mailhella sp.]
MSLSYFSRLFPRLQDRIRQDVPSALPLNNDSLRRCLNAMLTCDPGAEDSLTDDPAFEATFGWKQSGATLAELRGTLLDERLVRCLSNPPEERRQDYEFPLSRRPYTHQLAAWQTLCSKDPASAVISSGTGSGKTECFMIPILDRLARQSAEEGGRLEGVRALFLYPLNALISSQRDRLDAWTRGFNGDVRFCLYNGQTPPSLSSDRKTSINEVLSRDDLRASPPPILFTNASMLEYMLVRTEDAPILQKSQGKLEWIVLDEAHCYIGSQAAELSLLLRRVQMAFGVKPENVRFVATSATIGDPDGPAGQELKRFLADVAGVPASQVSLIAGEREIPALPDVKETPVTLDELENMDRDEPESAARHEALCRSKTARALRSLFTEDKNVVRLSEVRTLLKKSNLPADTDAALRWLDVLSWTKSPEGVPFLPLRAHIFVRGLSGLWACADPNCPHRQKELGNDWPYGAVWTQPREHCSCGSPVYEVVTCRGCHTPFLLAQKNDKTDEQGRPAEFLMQKEHAPDLDDEDDGLDNEEENVTRLSDAYDVLLVRRNDPSAESVFLNRETFRLTNEDDGHALCVSLKEPDRDKGCLVCPRCQELPGSRQEFYSYHVIGTPYLQNTMAPVLLEFAPDGKDPVQHPFRGRKMLTFNDSRQGTARSAMRMQLFSELARIRGLLYHIGLRDCRHGDEQERARLKKEIAELEKGMAAQSSLSEFLRIALQKSLDNDRQKLASLDGMTPVLLDDMARKLQNERSTFDALHQIYQEKAPALIASGSGASNFARMLVYREFGRRPARAVNLETLGLMAVRYPALEKVTELPWELKKAGLTLSDWKNFLKICLDFLFRGNGATDFPVEWRKWLGMTYRQTYLLPPGKEKHGKFQLIWPQCRRNRQHRLVRLLERALRLDATHWEHADIIDSILRQAWNQLTGPSGLCSKHEDGVLLNSSAMGFAPMEKAWLCPFTRRFLDTVFVGLSPYLPRKEERPSKCLEYTIPLYPDAFGPTDENGVKAARSWLSENKEVQMLRQAGLWLAPHDNVVELTPYFRVQEHSAQLSSAELKDCTKLFRDGDINVLSCSTTMEMGIDIGGISVVGMNNVPPHPANYLQRSGRSGRRGETRALTVTLCKDNPHEMAAFANSRWAFDTALPVPRVSLNSPVILQRHINALLLTAFLKERQQKDDRDLVKLSCDAFFTGKNPTARLFSLRFRTLEKDSPLLDAIRLLCRNGIFENERPEALADKAADAMDRACDRWRTDYDALCRAEKDMQEEGIKENSASRKAVAIRKKRMTGEYLLKELISQEFLPAHGFPLHVATFDPMYCELLKKQKVWNRKDQRKMDNLFLRRELPSRSLSSALTEYAPGNSVAINGLVYESKGITLNWHIPASEKAAAELQNIRSRWKCKSCGSFGTAASHSLTACSNCGAPLTSDCWHEYLEPAGFAVDFFSEPSNNVALGTAGLSHAEADVCACGPWISLGLPEAVRFRCTTSGTVFHRSRGLYGKGYAVCLACGRVESVSTQGEIPAAMRHHTKLRGGKNEDDPGKNICPACREGMSWKIKAPLWLACEGRTDVLEVQLRKEDLSWLNDESQAFPIAIALRDALAARLGIQTEELECTVSPRRREDGTLCTSLFIFDKNAAGYASSAATYMTALLHDARERLLCKGYDCETACPRCILSFDLRYQSRDLDRHKGLEVLTPAWLSLLALPDNARIFGPSTTTETMRLEESVLSASLLYPNATVCLHLGPHSLWMPGDGDMLHLLDILRLRQVHVELSLEKELYDGFSQEERMLLAPLVHGNVTCCVLEGGFSHPHARLAVTMEDETLHRWAVYEEEENRLLLTGRTKGDLGTRRPIQQKDLQATRGSCAVEQIASGETTTVMNFGAWLWGRLHLSLKRNLGVDPVAERRPLTRIVFSDRYCKSPLTVALLYRLLKQLRDFYGEAWPFPVITAKFSENSPQDYYRMSSILDNWARSSERDTVAELALKELGTVHAFSVDKKLMAHARSLRLEFKDGSMLTIWLDQGLGFLRVLGNSADRTFPFRSSVEDQKSALMTMEHALSVTPGGTIVSLKMSKV